MSKPYVQSIAIDNSTMFAALNRSSLLKLYSRPRNFFSLGKKFSCTVATAAVRDAIPPKYSTSRSGNLFSRISPVRRDNDVVQVLDQWVAEGRKVYALELQRIIRDLRSRKRFSQALKVSEWISQTRVFTMSPSDHAVHVDLIGVVQGWKAAESYFKTLSDQDKNAKTFGALLNCYVQEDLLIKTLVHMQRMKDLGYCSSLAYNNLMALYKKTGKLEKIPEILSEMKTHGVAPNNFSYRMCIQSFGERSDLSSMEKLLDEIESKTDMSIDWNTYSIAAYHFIKANEKEKAFTCMKKLEEKLDKEAMGYNHLISLYAHLGDKDEMMRLWGLQKLGCKKQINRDYITMLASLVKLGEFEAAETVLKEWDSSHHTYDSRVPNTLLIGYCQKGLVEKSEKMLRDSLETGEKPTPNSWAIVSAGYLDKGNMGKALECMKWAIAVKERDEKWKPKPGQITKILQWLSDEGEIEEVEAFVWQLRTVMSVNKQMYHALIKASVRVGRDTASILDAMKTDEIDLDDEMKMLLCLR
ncbi:hypothetical protein ACS0TY_016935 [Phlomoides rotata]